MNRQQRRAARKRVEDDWPEMSDDEMLCSVAWIDAIMTGHIKAEPIIATGLEMTCYFVWALHGYGREFTDEDGCWEEAFKRVQRYIREGVVATVQ